MLGSGAVHDQADDRGSGARSSSIRIQTRVGPRARDLVKLVAVIALLIFQSCSHKRAAPARAPLASTHTERELPYDLVIFEELNDGQRLYLDGELRSSSTINPESALLRLALFKEGEQLRQEVFPLTRIARESGLVPKPGEPFPFVISAEAAGATNYQIELLWGEEAQLALAELQTPQSKALELSELEIRECPSEERCEIPFLILGKLVNNGSAVVQSVELAIGFALSAAGTTPISEEKMRLDNLAIEPGQSKAIRFTVDQPMSAAQRKQFTPTVRLISFS